MVDPIARFTSLDLASPVAKPRPAPEPTHRAEPPQPPQAQPPKADAVDVRLSAEARALLSQIAAARGEKDQESRRPEPPGARLNIVI